MTKVTAIVSAYFSEPYLQGRLKDLDAQGLGDDLQIIVVCQAGSVDEEIAFAYLRESATPERILIVSTLDVPTVYGAWNLGIEPAKGDYITNANSDDRLMPGALKAMADALDTHPRYAVAYTNINRVLEIGGSPEGVFEWIEGGLKELFWQGCFLGPMPMWRRSLHAKYGLFDPRLRSAGDLDFWMRLANGGEKFFHIPCVYGDHLERLDALEHREPVRAIVEVARIKAKYRAKMVQV
jgi:glycosyltransferase involved in cell wall biosynthesis